MKTSSITTELGTPLSFSFANFIPNSNNLKNQKVTKPTFSHLNLENDIDKVLQSMKQQCEIEYAKLNELTSKIKHFEHTNNLSEKDRRIALLKAEEQILDEEIEEQKKNQKILTTKPHVLCELSVMKHIQETIEQYNKLIPQIHKEIDESKEQIEREKNLLSESEIIHNVLLNKLEKLQLDESDDESESQSEIGAIRQELRSIKSNYNMLMDELNDFIDTNFPPPNFEKDEVDEMLIDDNKDDDENEDEDRAEGEDEVHAENETRNKRFLTLKDMLENLMNQTYNNPNNPYITFDPERIWPPYVETLIRSGIAKRNPNDANMLKLVEFHL
ncbi:hypothetical protein RhiirB3_400759 [Rhizophagus irregularis]|nr:hypothetical protein RhiirB3_400759 [Rhizophagus irregularis]